MAVKFRIKAIGPKKIFSVSAGQAAREKALSELADDALELFEKTTATWEHKPVFIKRVNIAGENVSITSNDKIFGYVDLGTVAHVIRARNANTLAFTVGGSPKTRPRVLSSSRGSRGDVWVSKAEVHHPGTEAREFSVIIQERIQKKFVARFKEVLKEYESGEAPGL